MNIVFWSPFAGVSKVSCDLMAVALSTAIHHKVVCSVMQMQFNNNGLMNCMFQESDSKAVTYFENTGIDALVRAVNSGGVNKEVVEDCSFSFVERRLNVFTKTAAIDKHTYKSDLLQSMEDMFDALNDTFKINYIDVPAGVNECSEKALKLADVVIVCLPQSEWMIKDYLNRFSFGDKKVFHLFGDYDSKQYVNTTNVVWKNYKQFSKKYVGVVPHCYGYANDCNRGRAIAYFAQNEKAKKSDPNYEFISEVNETTKKILKICGLNKG